MIDFGVDILSLIGGIRSSFFFRTWKIDRFGAVEYGEKEKWLAWGRGGDTHGLVSS